MCFKTICIKLLFCLAVHSCYCQTSFVLSTYDNFNSNKDFTVPKYTYANDIISYINRYKIVKTNLPFLIGASRIKNNNELIILGRMDMYNVNGGADLTSSSNIIFYDSIYNKHNFTCQVVISYCKRNKLSNNKFCYLYGLKLPLYYFDLGPYHRFHKTIYDNGDNTLDYDYFGGNQTFRVSVLLTNQIEYQISNKIAIAYVLDPGVQVNFFTKQTTSKTLKYVNDIVTNDNFTTMNYNRLSLNHTISQAIYIKYLWKR